MNKCRDSIAIQITVKIGDQVMTVTDRRPLFLGGDRRRWRRQIAEHVQAQAEILGQRFGADAIVPVSERAVS